MSRDLQELLRIVPACEASVGRSKCKRNAAYHVRIAKGDQSVEADVCGTHLAPLMANAKSGGATVTKLHEWSAARV